VKGVELGAASEPAAGRGSEAHDSIARDAAHTTGGGFRRGSDRAGGLEGGMTTGSLLVVRATMKPLSTLTRPVLETVDLATGDSATAFKERTDVTAVPAMGVVAEAMVALVLASEAIRKFGGDSVRELQRNAEGYLADAANVAHLDAATP
jgi:chorismate synthase